MRKIVMFACMCSGLQMSCLLGYLVHEISAKRQASGLQPFMVVNGVLRLDNSDISSTKGLLSMPNVKEVKELDISRNVLGGKWEQEFDEIFELDSLERLDLSHNYITWLPEQIKRLKKLKVLSLAYNKLHELPKEIAELKNLEVLVLTGNLFSTITKKDTPLEGMTGLRELYIDDLEYLAFAPAPSLFKDMPHLKLLQVSQEKVTERDRAELQEALPNVEIRYKD